MKAKSQSHRDIVRGRSEKRDVHYREVAPRTRSLTRDEAMRPQHMGSRSDSKVTFAEDTTSYEIPGRRLSTGEDQQPEIIIAPAYDDSSGGRDRSPRERSPARFELEENTANEIGESVRKLSTSRAGMGLRPMRANSRSENDEYAMHGSSEFMLVLCPHAETEESLVTARPKKDRISMSSELKFL